MKFIHRAIFFTAVFSAVIPSSLDALEPGYISLFDRDHVNGWKQCGSGKLIVNGDITTTSYPAGSGYYGVAWYAVQTFSDFDFRVEFRSVHSEFNSGLRLRFPDPGDNPKSVSDNGYEVCINHPTAGDTYLTGGIQRAQPPTSSPLRGKNEWNELAVTAIGQRYTVKLNGKEINNFTGSRNLSGYIGLECHKSGPVQFRNVRIKDLSAAVPSTPLATIQSDPNQPRIEVIKDQGPNATEWALTPLDEAISSDIRQNLTFLREDLLDEVTKAPKANPEAYKQASDYCDKLLAALNQRELARVQAGYRAAQAEANKAISNQALDARRNYKMSWPQYAREESQRSALRENESDKADVKKERLKVEWTRRSVQMRSYLDDVYAKFREALRQPSPAK